MRLGFNMDYSIYCWMGVFLINCFTYKVTDYRFSITFILLVILLLQKTLFSLHVTWVPSCSLGPHHSI